MITYPRLVLMATSSQWGAEVWCFYPGDSPGSSKGRLIWNAMTGPLNHPLELQNWVIIPCKR